MRIYISGPMTGVPHYKMIFDAAETFLRKCGFAVINPARITYLLPEAETTYEEYLRVDFTLIDFCEVMYMLDGWENSQGAKQEKKYAELKGMPIFYQKDIEEADKPAEERGLEYAD